MGGGDRGEMDGYVVPNNPPIDVPVITSIVGAAIIDVGGSGLGPGSAPVTPSATALPTNAPRPEIDATHCAATDPYVDFVYALGSDRKLYGPNDKLPPGPHQRLHLTVRQSAHGTYAVISVETSDGRVTAASSAPPLDINDRREIDRQQSDQNAADKIIVDKTADAASKDAAMETWSRIEQSKEDRGDLFISADARTSIRQTLAQLQKTGRLYSPGDDLPDVAEARSRKFAIVAGIGAAIALGGIVGLVTADKKTTVVTSPASAAPTPTPAPSSNQKITSPPQGTHDGEVALSRTDPADSAGCRGTVATFTEPFRLIVSGLDVTISFTAPGAVPAVGTTDSVDAFTATGGGQTWSGKLTDPVWNYKISELAPLSCAFSAGVTFVPPLADVVVETPATATPAPATPVVVATTTTSGGDSSLLNFVAIGLGLALVDIGGLIWKKRVVPHTCARARAEVAAAEAAVRAVRARGDTYYRAKGDLGLASAIIENLPNEQTEADRHEESSIARDAVAADERLARALAALKRCEAGGPDLSEAPDPSPGTFDPSPPSPTFEPTAPSPPSDGDEDSSRPEIA